MKKLISVLICFSMIFSFASTAFAAGGLGTEASPYLISTVEELQAISSDLDSSYRLVNDIDLDGVDFSPIGDASVGAFTGSFDGNGYKISNFFIISSAKHVGLFGYCDGEIKNLTLENADVEGGRYTGGIVGYLDINGSITDCSVSGTVYGECTVISAYVGGIAGYSAGVITDCENNSSVSACAAGQNSYSSAGGIVGYCVGRITDCENNSTVHAYANVHYTRNISGGIVGEYNSESVFENCINNGLVTADCSYYYSYTISKGTNSTDHDYNYYSYVGGLIGYGSKITINNSSNNGKINLLGEKNPSKTYNSSSSGYTYYDYFYGTHLGGILGYAFEAIINNSTNLSDFEDVRSDSGGLAGKASSIIIDNCFNYGNVNCAGFVYSCSNAQIKNSNNYGNNLTSGFLNTGSTVLIENCNNYGSITSKYDASGFVYNAYDITISNCSNYGVITSKRDVAGFVTSSYGSVTISNCSNYGDILIDDGYTSYAGGFVARANKVNISKSKNIAQIHINIPGDSDNRTSGYVGGLCGEAYGTISECSVYGDIYLSTFKSTSDFWGHTDGYAGGIVGKSNNSSSSTSLSVKNCSIVSNVSSSSGHSDSGAIVGKYEYPKYFKGDKNYYIGSCRNSYGVSYTTNSNFSLSDGLTILTEEKMKNSKNFVGWDFETVWICDPNINSGYPTLRCFYDDLNLSEQYIYLKPTDNLSLETFYGEEKAEDVEWVSSNEAVATVSENGTVTPVSGGNVIITAKDSAGRKAMCYILIRAESNGIILEDTTVNLNSTATLTATNLAGENIVKWESSDSSVVSVSATTSSSSKLTARKIGTATITATSTFGNTATCTVTVTSYATSISLPETASINRGDSTSLALTVSPSPTQSLLSWTSSDNSIATVDENGVVTGVSCGTVVIIVETDNGLSDICTVTVLAPAESLTMERGSITLTKGFTDKVVAIPSPEDTTDTITYTSSNTSCVTINPSTGVITGVEVGTSTITATSTSGKKAYCVVTVVDVENPVTDIYFEEEEINISKNEIVTLEPVILPADATNQKFVWCVSDPNIATVTQTGVVKGINGGTTTVTATTADGGYTAECIVNVIVNVDSVSLNLTEETLSIGETTALEAVISPANATNKNVSWSSNDDSVATVDENGIVTAVSKGTATITVTTEDWAKTATCVITVIEPVTAVEISQNSASVVLNEILQLSASVVPSETKYTDIIWSSSDETVATVSENGIVTANKLGIATITATAHNGVNAVCEIYVVAFEGAEYTEFECEKTADGTAVRITAYCGTSSDVVIPKAIGGLPVTSLGANLFADCKQTIDTLTITKTVTEIEMGSFDSSVGKVLCYENSVAHTYCKTNGINYEFIFEMTVNPSSVTMTKGNGKQLSVNITPSTMADTAIKWTSSNIAIATVDENGVVTGVGLGTTSIVVSTIDGGYYAICEVVVTGYKVEYYSDGNLHFSEYLFEGEELTVPDIPIREGYTFEKWSPDVAETMSNENLVYEAVWNANVHNVSFIVEGETYHSYDCAYSDVITTPDIPQIEGCSFVGWTPSIPETMPNNDISFTAVFELATYTATFVADGTVISTQTFTIETESLDEPPVPQKAGYYACWSGYTIEAKDMTIVAKYYSPEAVMISKRTLDIGETYRLLPSCNFEVTDKSWKSSDTSVATVNQHGKVTAVGEGECRITVTCYGKDSLGNDIQASKSTKIIVNGKSETTNIKQSFREMFDEFFEVTLHDILYNFREFMIVLLRYAY